MAVVTRVSLRVGQVTLEISWRTSRTNCTGDAFAISCNVRYFRTARLAPPDPA